MSRRSIWNARFEVVDWENYATIGVGGPQELITQQTLEKYRGSLVLVIGIIAQRLGSPTSKSESGTEKEFNWAMKTHVANDGWSEIKWFFRKVDKLKCQPIQRKRSRRLSNGRRCSIFANECRVGTTPSSTSNTPMRPGLPRSSRATSTGG